MIVDASALVAIVLAEPDADALIDALLAAEARAVSAPTLLEASIVIDSRKSPIATRRFDDFIEQLELEVIPFSAEHGRIARQAYRDFGRGSGHAANLNFGDCFSYALAAERREPLLYVGDHFGHTDVRSALG